MWFLEPITAEQSVPPCQELKGQEEGESREKAIFGEYPTSRIHICRFFGFFCPAETCSGESGIWEDWKSINVDLSLIFTANSQTQIQDKVAV